MVNGPTTFRATSVKPYHRAPEIGQDPNMQESQHDPPAPVIEAAQPRRRGRPPGSKNKRKATAYTTQKERDQYEMAVEFRHKGVITTPGDVFEASDAKEIEDLLVQGVFSFERYDPVKHGGHRIFKFRMVREVKGISSTPYEKSRLVIQGHSDEGKGAILTQSPTIQRASQRLVVAIAAYTTAENMSLALRDITQAYPQAQSTLQRLILAHLPKELEGKYPSGTIIRVIRPLYGVAESGVHWFATYQGDHRNKLEISTSTYDPCLLITDGDKDSFGMVAIQTDDTLILGTASFAAKEEEEIEKAKFRTKPKTSLSQNQRWNSMPVRSQWKVKP